MRSYVNLREFGHQSVFGETKVVGMTECQSRLLSTTHLYDVIRSSPDVECQIPDAVLPYPIKLHDWYNDLKETQRQEREKATRGGQSPTKQKAKNKRSPATYEDESDAQALAVWFKNNEAGVQKWQEGMHQSD